MDRPVNPYVAGAPLRGERGFFGRQDTLDWVARELRNPATNALVLFGQRRIGKTSLLLQLQRILLTDVFLPVYFDLQVQAIRSLGQVLVDLADTVAERAGLELSDLDAFDDQGRFFRRTFLPQLYQALGENQRLVFLLDEFDVLDRMTAATLPETAAANAFFPFLRRVMTEGSRPAFVFVVGRRAEDLSLDFMATFKASLVQEIWVLDQKSAEALVRQAEANGTLRFTDQAVARILSLTSGHPYLTQLLCQRVWERAYAGNPSAPPLIDVSKVEAAVPDALEVGDQALIWLWNGLSPAEKIYAAALAEAADEGKTISEDRVIQVLTEYAARLRTREVELAPRDLVKRRVLEAAGEREYRFAVELFRCWVRQHKPLRDVKDEIDGIEPWAEQLFGIGQRSFHQRQWEEAVDFFHRALTRNPRHFRARLHLGETLLEQGQTDEAVAELEQAYELDRDEARLSLARALVAQAKAREEAGDEDGTLAACEQALQISPNERTAQEMKAAIWTRRGDAALERDDLEAALAAYGETGDTERIAQVGDAALERDDLETALAAYREAGDAEKIAQVELLQQRRALATLEAQAQAHEQAEAWAETAAVYEQLVAQAPDKKSRAAWQAALERCREEEELARLFAEGIGALEQGDRKRAQRAFAEVIHRRPDYRKDRQLAASLLEEAAAEKKVAVLVRQLPGWAWVLVLSLTGVLLLGLGIGAGVRLVRLDQQGHRLLAEQATTSTATVAPTVTPMPPTAYPTYTPYPTYTLVPTYTPVPPTPTPQPPTGTPTPVPPIDTPTPVPPTDTPTSVPPTDTPTPVPPTATAEAGQVRVSPIDRAEMVYVPAGEFIMGSRKGSYSERGNERPVHTVYLDAFYIDKYEVTNANFAGFVEATGYKTDSEKWWYSRRSWQDAAQGKDDHPVVYVTWNDADSYCRWAGRRLPTEAEWEKAARGTDGRIYPWGEEIDCDHAQVYGCGGQTAPVGSKPKGASPYGALDMAGNVWEWVADWYDQYYYIESPERNPLGPDSGSHRVVRGGSWKRDPFGPYAHCAYRRWAYLSWWGGQSDDNLGFRCAMSSP